MNALFDHTKYATKKELFAFLVENKAKLIAQKKAVVKHADGIAFTQTSKANKSFKAIGENGLIQVTPIINTTNIIDSHKDVHLPGIWTKSLSETKYFILNQEHKQGFEDIIADGDDLKVFAEFYPWKELGFDFEGKTQALVFESNILKSRNEYMFNQYLKGYVRQHSVEMYYTKLKMAINDPDFKEEFAEWEKIFPLIVNDKEALDSGFFFPVYEAKAVGGAAVPRGSNQFTPTQEIKKPTQVTSKNEAGQPLQKISTFLFT